jgi:hypothetical protein
MPRKLQPAKISKRWLWRPVAAFVITCLVVTGIVLTLNQAGIEAMKHLGPRERFRVKFPEIHCDVPPGMDPHKFLAEVRYASGFPESFIATDEAERGRLKQAFLTHPWVESVNGISVQAGNIVSVSLKFRVPVLAVRIERGVLRLVDVHGILLPECDPPKGIAVLLSEQPSPASLAGKIWENESVKRAVELAATYRPASLELTSREWILVQRDGKTLHVPR